MTIKEKYYKIENWIKQQNLVSINTIQNIRINKKLPIQDIIFWYKEISKYSKEEKDIIFGDKILDIDYIKEKVITHFESFQKKYDEQEKYDDDEEYYGNGIYDEDGYYNENGYHELLNIIRSFDVNMLTSYYLESFTDDYEHDIDGGRKYFTRGSNLDLYAFNYIFHKLNNDISYYKYELENKNPFFSKVLDYDLSILDDVNLIKKTLNIQQKDVIERFNRLIDNIIGNFKEDFLKEKIEELKNIKYNE